MSELTLAQLGTMQGYIFNGYSYQRVADMHGVSRESLRRWVTEGKLEATLKGKEVADARGRKSKLLPVEKERLVEAMEEDSIGWTAQKVADTATAMLQKRKPGATLGVAWARQFLNSLP